jgi:hypothetical protein
MEERLLVLDTILAAELLETAELPETAEQKALMQTAVGTAPMFVAGLPAVATVPPHRYPAHLLVVGRGGRDLVLRAGFSAAEAEVALAQPVMVALGLSQPPVPAVLAAVAMAALVVVAIIQAIRRVTLALHVEGVAAVVVVAVGTSITVLFAAQQAEAVRGEVVPLTPVTPAILVTLVRNQHSTPPP